MLPIVHIHEEPALSETFILHVLARAVRVEADLMDHFFNGSEKRLAATSSSLLLANFVKDSDPERRIPHLGSIS
jgi:CRP/FNR family cyclic AMP-dependent transcriptional regulator